MLGIEPSAVGGTLTCSAGTWSETPAPAFAYRWLRDRGLPGEATIESATSSTYTVGPADELHSLSCEVIATNSAGQRAKRVSSNSVPVARQQAGRHRSSRACSGTPVVGEHADVRNRAPGPGCRRPRTHMSGCAIRARRTKKPIGSATSSTLHRRKRRPWPLARLRGDRRQQRRRPPRKRPNRWSFRRAKAARHRRTKQRRPSPGSAALGAPLTCSEGTWSGSPAPPLTYQWLRDGIDDRRGDGERLRGRGSRPRATRSPAGSPRSTAKASLPRTAATSLKYPARGPKTIDAPEVIGTAAVGEPLSCPRVHGGGSRRPRSPTSGCATGATSRPRRRAATP